MISRQSARLVADTPAIAVAHFKLEADPYDRDTNPGGYINLGTAENRLVWSLLAPRLQAARALGAADTRYAPLHGTARLRESIAGFLGLTRETPVDPEDLLVVSGATSALDIAATVLCDPGEAIAVPVPYYGALDSDLTGRSGAILLPVSPGPSAIAAEVRRARADGMVVRALAITSPHNPLGQVFSAGDLADIARACQELDLDLIADEIYANSVFGNIPFTSALTLPDGIIAADRVHVIWGFAKDFGLPGWKVGVLHTRGEQARAAARALAYFAPVSTDTQWMLTDLLNDKRWLLEYLEAHRNRLSESYAAVAGRLTEAGIAFTPAQAGLSVWTSLRPWLTEDSAAGERALWHRLIDEARVGLTPGDVFHAPEPGWFRLCHAVDAGTVAEGISRIRRVLP